MPSSSASTNSFFAIVPLDGGETCRHAMDACYLCGKPLSRICDIFMYRGDTPFCSEECRGVQMEEDEVRERTNAKILKERAARKEQGHGTSTSESNITCAANVPVAS
ncbi:uncharacterized protein LOC100827581 [Brachypodium distachyon]|uniref:FLZ-type domain-containing protein n=1 Tax=Brachypodium distachyon TaxID=15368 RepID=I1ICQ8_BRADI|nr:uncharacterized protein LOC100827581 [Brachypodium distachyon]KQK00819.1 hypothetical protein BRADI_3g52020v3 [Brachypodium distachyon]|eukprot:XP_003570123.1 uncharacterized protein LOC100827581 [Brachypodium distachyon]